MHNLRGNSVANINITLQDDFLKRHGLIVPVSARDLQEMELPPLEWVVKDILPVGVAVLAAKPKRGKSYLALDMCLAVCNGFDFLGFKTVQGDCLYFDIESGRRRPKDRIEKKLHGRQAPDNLYLITMDEITNSGEPKKIGTGFEQQLSDLLTAYPNINLVVIDIFAKIRQEKTSKTDDYERDYRDFGALGKIANTYNVCVLCVMHNTKGEHADPFDDIQGSAGVMGSLDTAMVIQTRGTDDDEAALYIRGRDIEEQKIYLSFANGNWTRKGTAEEIARHQLEIDYIKSNVVKTIFAILKDHDAWTGTAHELIRASILAGTHIGIDERSVGVELARFKDLLLEDGIQYTKERKSKGWEQTFRKI